MPRTAAVVGDNTIDEYLGAEPGRFVGGNALNVGAQLVDAGVPTAYLGAIGTDAAGRVIAEGIRRAGLDPLHLVTRPGTTAMTRIDVQPDGERVFVSEEFGVTADYAPDADAIAAIDGVNWVHLGMLGDAGAVREAMHGAWNDARGHVDGFVRPIISQDCAVSTGYAGLDVAFGSVGAGPVSEAMGVAEEAMLAGASLAVVTRGAVGALAFDGSRWWSQAAAPARVVDTTGAGDAFIAGFIAARLRNRPVAEALSAAAERAARTCEHRGGWPAARTEA
ncbi:fructoselysine 6-kinase [Agromyces terreus]|uniref:Fructoselysine 6-kinase n=1 Tax=Agromyces terreus TaxID=424795 RepID=A0A9X2H7H2_9MICO|nr:PfkB family carbohydrate kinase [Agromyces terreus]MCP2370844.1 fructoselysine 6-kinase [Agromyces terreus]